MRTLILAAFAGLATFTPASAADLDANKQIFRSYLDEVVNKRQPAAADRYLAVNFVEHNSNLPQGLSGRKRFVASVLAGFSDYHGER